MENEEKKPENQEEESRPKFYLETSTKAELQAKKQLELFFKTIAIPVFLAAIVQISAFFIENTIIVVWLVNLIIFLYLTFLLKYKYKSSLKQLISYTITVGVILGFIVALVRLITNYEFYLIFNLIAEPAEFAAFGALLSCFIYLILKDKNKKREEVKHGRTK